MILLKKLKILIVLSIFIISSCVSKKQLLLMQDLDDYDTSKVTSTQNTVQENDILKIDVTSLEMLASIPYNKIPPSGNGINSLDLMKLNGYIVSKNKTIIFPNLGEISVAGKTVNDIENDLKLRLESGNHLIKPNVTVRLLNAKVTVLGEVNNPGTFTFTEKNITLLQALGLAGDLTIDSNRKDIIIIRQSDGQRTITKLDLTSASFLNDSFQNILPNDVIIVNPNRKKVTSAGLVGNVSTFLNVASILLSTIILIR